MYVCVYVRDTIHFWFPLTGKSQAAPALECPFGSFGLWVVGSSHTFWKDGMRMSTSLEEATGLRSEHPFSEAPAQACLSCGTTA